MSRSNLPPQSPCRKFINFKGDTGQFFYYDKDNKENVEVVAPVYFIVLDELSTITGFNNEFECGIYSNEVHYLDREVLNVRTFKGGCSIIGKYADIKDKVKAMGGRYTKSVYAMLIHPDKSTELVNFKFHGGALNAWIDKKINVIKAVICINEFAHLKNGSIKYAAPIFSAFTLTEELDHKAIAMDIELQAYLRDYKNRQMEKEEAVASNSLIDPEPAAPIDKVGEWQQMYNDIPPAEEIDIPAKEDVGLDDLPF